MSQWDQVSEQFARLSLAADEAPIGMERVRAHEMALRLAQSNQSFAEEFVARIDLTQALYYVPDDPHTLVHFTWLRRALDPVHELEEDDRHAVLWRLKWAIDLIETLPEVPLSALVAAIDDVEEVYRAEGAALRPVYAARARLAQRLGDRDAVARELSAWLAEPRDRHSDCLACEHRGQSRLVAPDDPARALDLLAPVIDGDLTCGEEPRTSLADAALLRLHLGDVEGAVSAFRRSWHLAQDDPTAALNVGTCLRVLLRVGNTDRAIDLLLPRLGWLDDLPSPWARMWFSATAAHVLDRAAAVGLAPDDIDGRPVADVVRDLTSTSDDIAAAFDARYSSTVVSRSLAAAHDPSLVPTEPTLPPTRLPTTAAPTGGRRSATRATASTDVLERARALSEALLTLDPATEDHVAAWLRDRAALLPVEAPEQWAAVGLLDRVSSVDAPGDEHRAMLESAREASQRGGDDVGVIRCDGELALLDDDGAERAREIAAHLESIGAHTEAGGLWRRLFHRPGGGELRDLERAADAYRAAQSRERTLLCEVETAMALASTDPDPVAADARFSAVMPRIQDVPVLRSMALDARSRIANAAGDSDSALTHLRSALEGRGLPERARIPLLLGLCEVLVEQNTYDELEEPAADLVAAATRLRDPVLLAHGQRFLGLAYVETGRPVEAAELLEAALPVLRETSPSLVGPAAWALGNALIGLGQWAPGRTAFATASTAFEAEARIMESAHAQWRAGNCAWDAGDLTAGAVHYESAAERARETATVDLYLEALRSRAALRADTEDLIAGIADLDAAIGLAQVLADEAGVDDDEFDGEVMEPHVLRQGAHLLAKHGEVDAAVARFAAAQALVGAEFEVLLRAEGAMVLADHDRLAEADPVLREAITSLHALGLVDERVNAAGALARALDRDGRGEEAEQVWQRYGPSA